MKITPNQPAVAATALSDDEAGLSHVNKDKEHKPFGRIEMAEARHSAAVTALFDELRELLDQHDRRDDDDIPVYQWLQQISNQISKAQSGKGPMRDRYITIAEMALAAMLSISRNKE